MLFHLDPLTLDERSFDSTMSLVLTDKILVLLFWNLVLTDKILVLLFWSLVLTGKICHLV